MFLTTVSLRLAAAAFLIAAAMPAIAADTAESQAEAGAAVSAPAAVNRATAKPAKPAERKICKTIEVTGSRTAKKQHACLTERQWRDQGL